MNPCGFSVQKECTKQFKLKGQCKWDVVLADYNHSIAGNKRTYAKHHMQLICGHKIKAGVSFKVMYGNKSAQCFITIDDYPSQVRARGYYYAP
ncbi:hypothetical protein MIR68_011146 [Amoeboaphelidium protococcarum]|nr:hypothetical protein MIR68_011146 [Amoeboaphelidium protococcarum]